MNYCSYYGSKTVNIKIFYTWNIIFLELFTNIHNFTCLFISVNQNIYAPS